MGNFFTNVLWGSDPDIPHPFSGLTLRDVYNIQCTWGPVYAKNEAYGMEMFLRLFRKDHTTKVLFKAISNLDEEHISKSYQFKAHVKVLTATINTAVGGLGEPETIAALMNKLGETHHGRGVKRTHFEEFKEIWLDVLKIDLNFEEQVMASWMKFIDFIYKHIFDQLIERAYLPTYEHKIL